MELWNEERMYQLDTTMLQTTRKSTGLKELLFIISLESLHWLGVNWSKLGFTGSSSAPCVSPPPPGSNWLAWTYILRSMGGNSLNGLSTWSFLKHFCLRVARLLIRQFKAPMQVSPKRARQHLYYLLSSGLGSHHLLLITTFCLLRKSHCPTSFKGKDRLPPLDGGLARF